MSEQKNPQAEVLHLSCNIHRMRIGGKLLPGTWSFFILSVGDAFGMVLSPPDFLAQIELFWW